MKIVLKIFKGNISNCILCFLSSVLLSTVLFLFEGMKAVVLETVDEHERMRSTLAIAVQMYIYILLFIGVILILYTVNCYSRVRLKDYAMLMVLGSEKSNIVQMIMAEYGIICGISFGIGCIFGTGLLFGVNYAIQSEGIAIKLDLWMYRKIIYMTLLYNLLVIVVAITLNIVNLRRYSLASLLKYSEKKSHIPSVRISTLGACIGIIGLVMASIFLCRRPITYKKMKYGIIVALIGLYMCFTYMGSLFLYICERRKTWYDKHLFKIKNLYYRFSENKNIIFVIFVINFFVLVFVNVNIVEYGNTSSKYMWKYPFDYVWMMEKKDADSFEENIQTCKHETSRYPFVQLTSTDDGEYVGISLSSYQRVTKHNEQLQKGEILAVLQKDKNDSETMFQTNNVSLKNGNEIRNFVIKKEKKEVLFIAQQSKIIRILVLNDEDFNSIKELQNSDLVIVTQKFEKAEAVKNYLKQISEKDNIIQYSKVDLVRQDRQEDILTLIFYICTGIFLVISNMTILLIKVWSEIPELSYKYSFLKKIGMDSEDIKRNIKGEMSIYLNVPFALSVISGLAVLVFILQGSGWNLIFQTILLFGALLFLQVFYIIVIRKYGYKLTVAQMKVK